METKVKVKEKVAEIKSIANELGYQFPPLTVYQRVKLAIELHNKK